MRNNNTLNSYRSLKIETPQGTSATSSLEESNSAEEPNSTEDVSSSTDEVSRELLQEVAPYENTPDPAVP